MILQVHLSHLSIKGRVTDYEIWNVDAAKVAHVMQTYNRVTKEAFVSDLIKEQLPERFHQKWRVEGWDFIDHNQSRFAKVST